MNLFGTVLTYPAPSANYRGESELNRTVIQKVTDGRFDYPIISPEAMRNALREVLTGYGLPTNRERLEPKTGEGEKQQLMVRFSEYPNPQEFADDFFFGYLLAVKGKQLEQLRKERGKDFPLKRDSVLRMNLAKALEPYRYSTVFTQSPKLASDNPWQAGDKQGGTESALLHRETVVTAFQYPFALNLNDCGKAPHDWTRKLLQAIGELNGVSGNHARSYFEFAPASIVIRLTDSLVAGYETYGFKPKKEKSGEYEFPELIEGLLIDPPDYPPQEFYLGGRIVKEMDESLQTALTERGVTLDRNPQRLISLVSQKALGE
ncbi:CRISPR-associated fruiting body developmental protein R [Planctomycetales bacterium 10988]|nr:CRISPR-associated fruiting body developmental protein R [Planctomycetales bacterium 10988]